MAKKHNFLVKDFFLIIAQMSWLVGCGWAGGVLGYIFWLKLTKWMVGR